jgi:heat shock protein HtpX
MNIEADRGLQLRILITILVSVVSMTVFYLYVHIFWFILFVVVSGASFLYTIIANRKSEHNYHERFTHIQNRLERISGQAGIQTPELYIEKSSVPNALTYGILPNSSKVIITERMLKILDDDELDSVLAHEVAHIRNKDSVIMSILIAPVEAGFRSIIWAVKIHGILGVVLGFVFGPIATVLLIQTILMSGYREYAADRGSVAITGNKHSLISAIKKLDEEHSEKPEDDYRQRHSSSVTFYGDTPLQPDSKKRIDRIEKID